MGIVPFLHIIMPRSVCQEPEIIFTVHFRLFLCFLPFIQVLQVFFVKVNYILSGNFHPKTADTAVKRRQRKHLAEPSSSVSSDADITLSSHVYCRYQPKHPTGICSPAYGKPLQNPETFIFPGKMISMLTIFPGHFEGLRPKPLFCHRSPQKRAHPSAGRDGFL